MAGVEIFANPFADMVIKEVIEGCVDARMGILVRTFEAMGMPPEERLAYIYDWKAIGLDFGVGTLIGIGVGSTGIAFKSAAGEATEQVTKEVLGGNNKTGTVWDNIRGTADNIPGTEIPATFQIDLDESINYVNPETGTNTLWTNANATEHMGEYVGRFGKESWSIGFRSQEMLESYAASLNEAMSALSAKTPGRYFGSYGNWELGINTQTGVVYHAKMLH